ncbi:olfactory receptor 1020-like [Bufo bufo]|uniref:olfactory receptor 1020-like n=1 Tax=Bufo bufo TaxID=8384 RepID=UPI001ABE704E|nr:olfactory receptor 1020-like [Bufo bufo]
MDITNGTQVTRFIFSGLTNDDNLIPFLFILFFPLYIMTIMANVGLLTIVQTTSSLQNPMYFFLSYLSLVDVFYSSSVIPKMLVDLISKKKAISFVGCAFQFFVYCLLVASESLLFSTMSYDRYVAVCHPLHYMTIMTKKKCLCLVSVVLSIGFIQSSVQTGCTFTLKFCGSNLINHFYCDVFPVLKLSCSDNFTCGIITICIVCILGIGPLIVILLSYLLIIFSVSQIKSSSGRSKAFSTCSSHLMCVFIFYGSIFFTYLRSHSRIFTVKDKVASVFYTAVTPMLNPLIYSLRNQDVKHTVITLVRKLLKKRKWCSTST